MKHLNKLRVALCAAAIVVAVAFFACNKEKEPATQRQNALCDIKTPSQNNYDGGEIYERAIPSNNNLKPITDYPRCITELFHNPEYDIWDFSKIERPCEFDTAGYHTFLIPPKDEFMAGFNGLIITTERNPDSNIEEISQRYVMSFPLDCWDGFDPMWYYNHNELAYVEFLSYDYTEMFYCGYWDVRNDRINLTRSASGSGYWDYSTGGFHVTEFLPLWDLVHWRDFNDCEYGLLVAEGIVDVAAFLTAPLTGGLSAFLFTSFNSYAFNWMRKNVCN